MVDQVCDYPRVIAILMSESISSIIVLNILESKLLTMSIIFIKISIHQGYFLKHTSDALLSRKVFCDNPKY